VPRCGGGVLSNEAILVDVSPKVVAAAPDGAGGASNPVDLMTHLAARIARLPPGRVFGSARIPDSACLRALVGEHVGVAARLRARERPWRAWRSGGDSLVRYWSSARSLRHCESRKPHLYGLSLPEFAG
jgi:L-lactate dehydrogenase